MKHQGATHIENIISYLNQKKEYYEKILKLAKKQEEAIKSSNIKELILLITEKETYIKNIKRLETLNIKLQEEIMLNQNNLKLDKRFNSLLKQLQSIITKLKHYDHDSIKLLSSSIDGIKTKIININKKRRSIKLMRMQETRQPSFIDVIQ